ncbi:MAG: hypothetical protein K2X87_26870, partial [Gemmataceae bacterium]|nr:hypothetical protein [Gemmataceae bacterium]
AAAAVLAAALAVPTHAADPPAGVERAAALLQPPNLPADSLDPVWAPPFVERPKLPGEPAADPAPESPAPAPAGWTSVLKDYRLSQAYLPKLGRNGFGVNDTELRLQIARPGWEPLGGPLLLGGGFGLHFWDGPARTTIGTDPGLPGMLFDAYLDLGWKPRPAEWLFLDLGVTPGVYADDSDVTDRAFRLRGRGLATVAPSEKLQFVGGVLYVNRLGPKLIPAGGVRWVPNDDTLVQLVFPQPKAARRVGPWRDGGWWVSLAGEFGGGTWAYRRPDGSSGAVDYDDYRLILGSEWRRASGWMVRAELGYVFGRELDPLGQPRVTPGDTLMARLALVY